MQTPRTDANILGKSSNPELVYVNVEFARTLELELAAKEKEVEEWKKVAETLHGTLWNLKEVCKTVPQMNNRTYDLIGIQVNKALQDCSVITTPTKPEERG